MKTRLRLWFLLSLASAAGCGFVVEEGVRALVGDEGPPGAEGQYGAPSDKVEPAYADEPKAAATSSGLQYAPTPDWILRQPPRLYTPGQSIFNTLTMRGMRCQPVPMGMSQAFSGPTGPEGRPLASLGFLHVGLAGPPDVHDVSTGWDAHTGDLAWSSGASIASWGPTCGPMLFLQISFGKPPEPVSVLR